MMCRPFETPRFVTTFQVTCNFLSCTAICRQETRCQPVLVVHVCMLQKSQRLAPAETPVLSSIFIAKDRTLLCHSQPEPVWNVPLHACLMYVTPVQHLSAHMHHVHTPHNNTGSLIRVLTYKMHYALYKRHCWLVCVSSCTLFIA